MLITSGEGAVFKNQPIILGRTLASFLFVPETSIEGQLSPLFQPNANPVTIWGQVLLIVRLAVIYMYGFWFLAKVCSALLGLVLATTP